MIKKHGKWVGLSAAAIPILWFSIPASWMSSAQSAPVTDSNYEQPQQAITSHFPTPKKIEDAPLEFDSSALEVIRKSQQINAAKLNTELALEQAKAREATLRGLGEGSGAVPDLTVIQGGYTPQSNMQSATLSQDVLSRLSLNALITVPSGKTFAYLSIDNGRPESVSEGHTYHGALVSKITPTKVVVIKDKEMRVLRGQE